MAVAAKPARSIPAGSGTGVTVTALCPGPTDTEFPRRAGLLNTKAFKRGTLDAATVARAGYNAMMKGKRVVIHS